MRIIGLLVLAALLALGLLAASFPLQWWNISLEDLRARYQTPQSRFIDIDGAELHYQDEGNADGVPVVLLHGNFGSLRAFDDWVAVLGDRYRLIRFDIPATGLSGPDTSGDYTIDRRIFLMNLVLGNAGGLPRTPETNPNQPESNPLRRWLFQYYRPRSFFEAAVPGLIPNPAKRSADTAAQFHHMVTAKGRAAEGGKILGQFDSQDAQDYLEQVTCPVLLQWTTTGEERLLVDKDLSRFQAWLNNTSVATIEYAGAGHMLYQSEPERTAADVGAFIDRVLAERAAAEAQTGAVAGS